MTKKKMMKKKMMTKKKKKMRKMKKKPNDEETKNTKVQHYSMAQSDLSGPPLVTIKYALHEIDGFYGNTL